MTWSIFKFDAVNLSMLIAKTIRRGTYRTPTLGRNQEGVNTEWIGVAMTLTARSHLKNWRGLREKQSNKYKLLI